MRISTMVAWGSLLFGLFLGEGLIPSQAATTSPNPAGDAFAVTPLLPRDNVASSSYYHFIMQPRQTRRLQLALKNNSPYPGTYDVNARIASTNTNGILDYGLDNQNRTLPAQSQDLFGTQRTQVIRVNPRSTKLVTIPLTAPARSFEGLMLAGITVGHHAIRQAVKKQTGIVATTQYAIAIEFYNHTPTALRPQIQFHQVQYRLAQAQPQLTLKIDNRTRGLVSTGRLQARLLDHAGKLVAHFDQSNLQFAPQSQFGLSLDLHRQQLSAGHYTLRGSLTSRGNQRLTFNRPLTVTAQSAADVQHHAAVYAPKKQNPNWWRYGFLSLVFIMVGGLIVGGIRWLYRQPLGAHHD